MTNTQNKHQGQDFQSDSTRENSGQMNQTDYTRQNIQPGQLGQGDLDQDEQVQRDKRGT